ncbi:uncharacterized protein LOC111257290 [Setaria italica]|uniref:uncharacterized protein LOC111257290 n=1 Tax=Setaria italica TaxID=4555 RepID=UPI000BE61C7A|nr:uncharacterized protein LOC111257290 [Setaria italica]
MEYLKKWRDEQIVLKRRTKNSQNRGNRQSRAVAGSRARSASTTATSALVQVVEVARMHGERPRHRYPRAYPFHPAALHCQETGLRKSVPPPANLPTPPSLVAIPPAQGSASFSSTPHAPPFPSSLPSSFGVPPFPSAGRRHPIHKTSQLLEWEFMEFSWRWTTFAKYGVPPLIKKFSEELTFVDPR